MFCDWKRLEAKIKYLETVVKNLESKLEQTRERLQIQGLSTYGDGYYSQQSNLRSDMEAVLNHLGLKFVNNPAERVLVKKGDLS